MSKSPRLGRGLSALMADINPVIEDVKTEGAKSKKTIDTKASKSSSAKPSTQTKSPKADGITIIAINRIDRNPDQPRLHFDKTALAELTESIRDRGVLQPILLRPLPPKYASEGKTVKDRYQIVAGERRWQASLAAGLDQMPALIRDFSDREVLEVGVVENIQREDLNPIEEALAFEALKEQFGHRQQGIAQAIGKSRAYVANRMRLLQLPERAREYLVSGRITPGHANAILAYKDPMEL
ncbi:MAG: ParB/RepB/Spo0J family partition protein, partial [Methylococcales bacterium]|nr:ParB/RepB/Spo0J family partition protein [Methylococcales bacterium]